MPTFRGVSRHNYGNRVYMPSTGGSYQGIGSYNPTVNAGNGVGVLTQQAPAHSLVMGYQSPAQLMQAKVRSVLTQDEIALFTAMTAKVTAVMTPEELDAAQENVANLLNANGVPTDDDLYQQVRDAEMDAESAAVAVPPEGIQPGYNCLDPDMATTIVVNWLDHGDETIQDLNALNNPADPTYEQRKNFEITGGGVDYASMTDKEVTAKKSDRLRPHLSIRRIYLVDTDVPSCGGFAKEVAPNVNAMLAGRTLREPDSYLISDGLVEIEVNKLMIAEHRKPPVLTQQSLAVPSTFASQTYGQVPNRSRRYGERGLIADVLGPPADEIQGPSYDDILNERDKRLHDERLVQEGAITLSESGRSASKLTPKGTKMTVRFPMPRANPLTGVPDPAPRPLLLQEGIKALRQVNDDTADDLVQNHNFVGVQLELTEFDPALVPPGVDAAALVIEQGPAPALPSAPVVPQGMTATYTPTVDLATLDFDAMILEAYRTLEFTWSNCHPQDSAFSCLIMKAIETAEEWVRMSPLNKPGASKAVGEVLAPIHEALAVAVALPSPKQAPMSPAQLAQAIPGSTVTAGGISGTFITANANVSVQWQQVNAWSNQGGLQGTGQYLNVQAPLFQSPTDEDGDEIPSIRIRHLKPNHEYRSQDGTVIEVDATGNFLIKDEAAQITYRATRMRDFNRFVNGSDLVGEFIEALGKLGASQSQAADANLEMFIRWLVHKAAEHDKEEPPVDVPMVTPADVPAVALPAAPILITDDGVKVAELVGV